MQTVHPGGQLAAIQASKNVPKSSLPPGVSPADLPNEEFLKTIEEIEKAKSEPKKDFRTTAPPLEPLKKPQATTNGQIHSPVAEKKPAQLVYRYEGTCENGHQLTTLELDVETKHFVVAYCAAENKQVEIREVEDLDKTTLQMDTWTVLDKGEKFFCGCGKTFPTQKGLNVHTWRKHKKEENAKSNV